MTAQRRLRLLMVEDSLNDADLTVRALRRAGYDLEVRRVETADAMSQALDEGGWDVILSDYTLPRFSAPMALELVQRRGLDLPFVVLSGTIDDRVAGECMNAGATAVLRKGVLSDLAQTLARLLAAVEKAQE